MARTVNLQRHFLWWKWLQTQGLLLQGWWQRLNCLSATGGLQEIENHGPYSESLGL